MKQDFINRYEEALIKHLIKVHSKEDLAAWLIDTMTIKQLKDILGDIKIDIED